MQTLDIFMVNNLARTFNIRSNEGMLVALLMAHSLFVGIPRIITSTASTSLFIDAYGAQLFPVVYIAAALANSLVGLIFTRLEKRLRFETLLLGNLLIQALSLMIFWGLLRFVADPWPKMAFSIWFEVLWVLSSLQFWGLAGRLFDIRQGKRLFGIIGAGEVLAFVGIGIFGRVLVNTFGVENLLLLGAGSVLGSLLLVGRIVRQYAALLQPRKEDRRSIERHSKQGIFRNRYVLLVLLLALVAYLVFFFVDNAFYAQVELEFSDTTAKANFLIVFVAVSGAFSLLMRLYVSERIINRFGVLGGLLTLPLALGAASIGVILAGNGLVSFLPMFWATALAKLLDQVLRYSVNRSASQILYQPLPASQQLRTQTTVETLVEPVTGGIAGILLLGLLGGLGFTAVDLHWVALFVVFSWLVVVVICSREYVQVVLNALSRQRFGGHSLSFEDGSSLQVVRQRLDSPVAGEVLYAVNVLSVTHFPELDDVLIKLLSHPEPVVRAESLNRIAQRGLRTALDAVARTARTDPELDVRAMAVQTLATLGEDAVFSDLLDYLQSPEQEIRLGAMVGLLRSGGIEGVLAAGEQLIKMVDALEPSERRLAAQVLGEVGIRNFYRPLLKLLKDSEPGVRYAALISAGKLKNPRLWSLIVPSLGLRKTRSAAIVALQGADENIVSEFENAYQTMPSSILVEIARICARLPGARVSAFLFNHAQHPDLNVRHQVLEALSARGFSASDAASQQRILAALRDELVSAAYDLTVIAAVAGLSEAGLLSSALQGEVLQAERRIFLWLSFVYDSQTILQAWDNFRRPERGKRAVVLEAFDQLLPQDLKAILLPFLDDIPVSQKASVLTASFPHPTRSPQEYIRQLAVGGERWVDPWTRACAIYTTTLLKAEGFSEHIIDMLNDKNPMIAETALWSLRHFAPRLYRLQVHYLQNKEQWEAAGMERRSLAVMRSAVVTMEKESQGGGRLLLTIEKVIILKGISIFSETPEELLAEIAYSLTEAQFEAGETIINKGEAANCMYIIVEGEVKVHLGEVVVGKMGARDFFGDMALLDDEPRSASITALQPTRVLRIDREDFQEMIDTHPEIARGIMRVLSRRLRAATIQVDGTKTRAELVSG